MNTNEVKDAFLKGIEEGEYKNRLIEQLSMLGDDQLIYAFLGSVKSLQEAYFERFEYRMGEQTSEALMLAEMTADFQSSLVTSMGAILKQQELHLATFNKTEATIIQPVVKEVGELKSLMAESSLLIKDSIEKVNNLNNGLSLSIKQSKEVIKGLNTQSAELINLNNQLEENTIPKIKSDINFMTYLSFGNSFVLILVLLLLWLN